MSQPVDLIEIAGVVVSLLGVFATAFVGYHVFFLSKRLTFGGQMVRREEIQTKTDGLLSEIRTGTNSKVEILNVRRYKKDYPHNNEEGRWGCTYFAAELHGYSYDGVEFINSVQEAYITSSGDLTLEKTNNRATFNLYEVGVIPYDWIAYVDRYGDNTSYRPQYYANFKGRFKTPFATVRYYRENENYKKGDPTVLKLIRVDNVKVPHAKRNPLKNLILG